MSVYAVEVMPSCKKSFEKSCRKNSILRRILENKITEISLNPIHYKPLSNVLKGERRVHILKSFVLRFIIDEPRKTVIFISFEHHDTAYQE